MNQGKIYYANYQATCVFKMVGELRYTICTTFNNFLENLFGNDYDGGDFDNILIDLSEAESIDSTILGILARIANTIETRYHHKTTLVSTNEDVNRTLDTVGFYEVFEVIEEAAPADYNAVQLHESVGSEKDMSQTICNAHRILCQLNAENQKMFKGVVEAFEAEGC